jgi:hypothetical protein
LEPTQKGAVGGYINSSPDPCMKSRQPLTHSNTLATLPPADHYV